MQVTQLRVSEFMSEAPETVDAAAPLVRAHEKMRANHIRHLPVTRNGVLVGVVSMGDLHLIETLKGVDPTEVPVEDAMTDEPYVVAPDALLHDVVAEMREQRIGSAIVADGAAVVGIFTTVDALHSLLEQLRSGG